MSENMPQHTGRDRFNFDLGVFKFESQIDQIAERHMNLNAWSGENQMKIQCELCLLQYGYSRPSDNIKLVSISGVDTLVCKQHNPNNLFVQR